MRGHDERVRVPCRVSPRASRRGWAIVRGPSLSSSTIKTPTVVRLGFRPTMSDVIWPCGVWRPRPGGLIMRSTFIEAHANPPCTRTWLQMPRWVVYTMGNYLKKIRWRLSVCISCWMQCAFELWWNACSFWVV